MLINIPSNSWLKNTGQLWKTVPAAILILLSFPLMILDFFGVSDSRLEPITIALGVTGFAILILSIKCPHCNKRPICRILRKTNVTMLTQTILSFDVCPYCGYNGGMNNEEKIKEDIRKR